LSKNRSKNALFFYCVPTYSHKICPKVVKVVKVVKVATSKVAKAPRLAKVAGLKVVNLARA
jgi:hypothetical protein